MRANVVKQPHASISTKPDTFLRRYWGREYIRITFVRDEKLCPLACKAALADEGGGGGAEGCGAFKPCEEQNYFLYAPPTCHLTISVPYHSASKVIVKTLRVCRSINNTV